MPRKIALLGAGSLVMVLGCTGDIGPVTPLPEAPFMPAQAPVAVPSSRAPATPTAPTAPEGGTAGAAGAPAPVANGCSVPTAGSAPMRRLTREQYVHAVRDLLGISLDIGSLLPNDERLSTFRSNVVAPVSGLDVEQYAEVAELVAGEAVRDVDRLVACDRTRSDAAECARRFIQRVGKLAHRRPLTPAEDAAYHALFTQYGASDFAQGIAVVIEAMLQSPAFVYQVELPQPGVGVQPLSGHELATRLALFLWSTVPDDALLELAARGELATAGQVAAQARRMLADPRARAAMGTFHLQWLAIDGLRERKKDADAFPSYTPALAEAMLAETADFASHVILEGEGRLETLLTSSSSFGSAELLALYGVTRTNMPAGEPTALDVTQRAGVLTHASFLAAHAHANQSSPVLRGKAIRTSLLCDAPPAPPPDVNTTPPEPAPDATTRERFAAHTAQPRCASCHVRLDPVGFGFEHYDAIGRYRTDDQGEPVDASGEIAGTRDADGPFQGAVALAARLAKSEQVRRCVTKHWLEYALGRGVSDADACSEEAAYAAFAAADFKLVELLVAIAQSDAFRSRKVD